MRGSESGSDVNDHSDDAPARSPAHGNRNDDRGQEAGRRRDRTELSSQGVGLEERPHSPASSGASSYDVLQRSTEGLSPLGPNSAHGGSGGGRSSGGASPFGYTPHSPRSPDSFSEAGSPSFSSPPLSRSVASAEFPVGPGSTGSGEGDGVVSLSSSMSADATTGSSGSNPSRPDRSETRDEQDDVVDIIKSARLVTLHLDKIDGGIWPCLVTGPAPLSTPAATLGSDTTRPFTSVSSHSSLRAALSEALGTSSEEALHSGLSRESNSTDTTDDDDDDELATSPSIGPDSSTITVDTIGSDDSTTVLASRSSAQQRTSAGRRADLEAEEAAKFNMDPTSLALMGLRHARSSASTPPAASSATTLSAVGRGPRQDMVSFEYFARAWRAAEVPLATKILVDHYLPLMRSDTPAVGPQSVETLHPRNGADSFSSTPFYRKRFVAALGGPSALARLYVSYARLQLPSFDETRSPLSFPSGVLTNPFGGNTPAEAGSGIPGLATTLGSQPQSTLPPSRAFQLVQAGPLVFLDEARRLDGAVFITEREWSEASEIAEVAALEYAAEQEADAFDEAAFDERSETSEKAGSSLWMGANVGGGAGKRKKVRDSRRTGAARSRNHHQHHHQHHHKHNDPGVVFTVFSSAALLSVLVAGGVAAAGFWKRASAATGASGH